MQNDERFVGREKTPSGSRTPRVSVIINTDGRVAALRETIESFRHLDYEQFEICVVYGPTPDGTKEYAESLAGRVKVSACSARNLSQSRNIGLAMAAGDIVAFIDDDGIPETEWLSDLAPAFSDPGVGAAGGIVYDQTGYNIQYRNAWCDRLGNPTFNLGEPLAEGYYPFSSVFPYVQGTNCAFDRRKLVALGGFDEEYEFYLEETDVCCRMVDAGYKIAQLPSARVHHRFLPSSIRNDGRITFKKYAVMKSKIYFSLMCNNDHQKVAEIIADNARFIDSNRADLSEHVRAGRLDQSILEAFETDAEMAWRVGLSRGLSGVRRTRPESYFDNPAPFLLFDTLQPNGSRRTFVFMCQSYPPATMGGTARYTQDIAQAIGGLGHNVHVLTRSEGGNRVHLEGNAWIHRLKVRSYEARTVPSSDLQIPQKIWDYSSTMLEEIYRINATRKVDVVEAVSWDCEAAAPLLDGTFPTVTNVVTSLAHWLQSHDTQRNDAEWMASYGDPMLSLEREIYTTSPRIIAASKAISLSLEQSHDFSFRPGQVGYCEHGLLDMLPMPRNKPSGISDAETRRGVLFVGRLELRKGIDTLLEAAPFILDAHPDVDIWIAGDDSLILDGGKTARAGFESSERFTEFGDRVKFLGAVSDEELRWLYANCVVFVAPSRFESFGLIYLEAYMFSKPVVGCDAGAVPEVVRHGVDGLLVAPGNVDALADAVTELLFDPIMQSTFGRAGREAFDARFAATEVARKRASLLLELLRDPIPSTRWRFDQGTKPVDASFDSVAHPISSEGIIEIDCLAPVAYLTFFKNACSGHVQIEVPDGTRITRDLFSENPALTTVRVEVKSHPGVVRIQRTNQHNHLAQGDEVIVVGAAQAAY